MSSGSQVAERAAEESVLEQLCATLFASLPRHDQRRKGVEYLTGLLRATGRKSIRNIALAIGDQATEQYLHHFICDSTWEAVPVRRALAEHVWRVAPPRAWVVRPLLIPKAGRHSVGVGKRFAPDLGHTLNAQQALGVWSAAEDLTAPVDWRLRLSPAWVGDAGRRSRAAIPDGVRAESELECGVEAYLGVARFRDRPLVIDGRGHDVGTALTRLRRAGAPLLMRVSGTHRFTAPLLGPDPLSARQVMSALHAARRPVAGHWPLLAATSRVHTPDSDDLVLLGIGSAGHTWPTQLWLSNQPAVPAADLVRTSLLLPRVDHDFARYADRAGTRDFTGRSFAGWHRHMTLASAAHTILATADARTTPRPVTLPQQRTWHP
ncbi:IS701 family transposase [Actinokineospora terrae]|uniref:DDE superfamily endonuclease n=1 Tax=Actinokineospora terrae TaxID=155974 RepID=A0A1H9X1F9_9PSEU|nr:transposase [Actinokineospora terrae]SES39871.1 DDE superfamily endonuclease [Actinokineospora terrae]